MRFTQVLFKRGKHHKFKLRKIWRHQGFVVQNKTMVPEVLKHKGEKLYIFLLRIVHIHGAKTTKNKTPLGRFARLFYNHVHT